MLAALILLDTLLRHYALRRDITPLRGSASAASAAAAATIIAAAEAIFRYASHFHAIDYYAADADLFSASLRRHFRRHSCHFAITLMR